jgi:hypothetical protein
LLAFVLAFSCHSNVDARELTLPKILEQSSHPSEYAEPTVDQLIAFRELAESTLAASQPYELLRDRWLTMGWSLERIIIHDQTIWLVVDAGESRRGAGMFAIRPHSSDQIMVQAPHSYFDEYTRPITVRMFERSNIRAAAWNTVHRQVLDVAHSERSYFHEFTKAFLASAEKPLVVQIHGFSQDRRRTVNGVDADIIVSNGTRFPPQWLRITSQELHAVTPNVRLFPTHINELGATTNAQALLSNQVGANFLHVELSDPQRRTFRRQTAVIDEFLKCILAGYRSL